MAWGTRSRLGRPTGAGLRAEISMPDPAACADGFGESLAVRNRAGQSAEIAAVADRFAGDKECHRGAALETVLCESHRGNCNRQQHSGCEVPRLCHVYLHISP